MVARRSEIGARIATVVTQNDDGTTWQGGFCSWINGRKDNRGRNRPTMDLHRVGGALGRYRANKLLLHMVQVGRPFCPLHRLGSPGSLQPLLCFITACSRKHVDLADQRVLVEDQRHLLHT